MDDQSSSEASTPTRPGGIQRELEEGENSCSEKNLSPVSVDTKGTAPSARMTSIRTTQSTILYEEIDYTVAITLSHNLPKRMNEKKLHPTYEVKPVFVRFCFIVYSYVLYFYISLLLDLYNNRKQEQTASSS
jgi:hypothetical protein